MGFIYDDSITIPNNKDDGGKVSIPSQWVASDANLVANALLDTRTAITGGDYLGLRDMSGGLPDVSPAGGVQLVSNAGELQISSDGGAYAAISVEPTATTGIVAHAGGGQGSATQLAADINIVSTVATANDSVKLATAALGSEVVVINTGANPLALYPATGGSIVPLATNAAYVLGPGETVTLIGQSATQWGPSTQPSPAFYDIRNYGAFPGTAGKAATTAAFNAIFADINWEYFPTVEGKRAAVIYVPAAQGDSWYTDDLDEYLGTPGAGIYFKGDMPSGRSSTEGSTLIFDGTSGTTWFKFLGINSSTFENITFNGGSKALVLIQLSQKWYPAPDSTQIGSSGVRFDNCQFVSPVGDYDSILVQAGSDDDPPNTMQSSEYRFYNCQFQGHNAIQGWGFKAVVAGNTKNFTFDNCTFSYVYRGIEANSGYLICREVQGGVIGYDRDENAAMIYTGCLSVDITGGGLENGNYGYFARWLIATQNAHVKMSGSYIACTPPADDFVISAGNALIDINACDFSTSRTTSSAIAWTALTAILEGQQRLNDGGKWYVCTQAGTTGNTGGPTGTGSAIVDGSAEWDWVTSAEGNVAKLQLNGLLTDGAGQQGSATVKHCTFPYVTTPITATPIYDGSNPICPGVGGVFDYARSVGNALYTRGNRTGLFGSDIDDFLPDVNGVNVQNSRDQFWTNYNASGCTVIRNDSGVYIITVPAAAIAASAGAQMRIGDMYPGMRVTDALIDVTTLFSGPGVTGIEVQLGNGDITDDDILLSASVEATGQIGLLAADRGAGWEADRYIVAFNAPSPLLTLKCTVSGGSIASINAGSLNVYVQFQRLKA